MVLWRRTSNEGETVRVHEDRYLLFVRIGLTGIVYPAHASPDSSRVVAERLVTQICLSCELNYY
jgi:hypothetical protein